MLALIMILAAWVLYSIRLAAASARAVAASGHLRLRSPAFACGHPLCRRVRRHPLIARGWDSRPEEL